MEHRIRLLVSHIIKNTRAKYQADIAQALQIKQPNE